jgi:tRNA1(Val) A37 N6-methylase TrmN6
MKSTNKAQTTEALNEKAIALHWQDCIVEDLNDDAQAAVSGGGELYYITDPAEARRIVSATVMSGLGMG